MTLTYLLPQIWCGGRHSSDQPEGEASQQLAPEGLDTMSFSVCISNFTFQFSEFASQVILDQSGPPDQLKLKTAKDLGTIEEEFKNKTWLYEFKGEVSGMRFLNIPFHVPKLGC